MEDCFVLSVAKTNNSDVSYNKVILRLLNLYCKISFKQERIMNMSGIETKAMSYILWAYVLMAVVGIGTFAFSNSEAVLIDGVFNFISAFSMIIGIKISKLVAKKPTKSLPFGFAMYETLYTLFKGLLIFGVLVLAGVSNSFKIYDYIVTGSVEQVNGGSIIYYSILMVIICSLVYLYIAAQCKKVNNQSIMLQTEKIAVFQNAIISGAIGVVFLLVGFLENTSLAFIVPIADSIIVLVLCVFLFNDPVKILKNAFNELIIKDIHNAMREKITPKVLPILPLGYSLKHVSINRLGRTYYFLFLINPSKVNLSLTEIENIQDSIKNIVKSEAPFSFTDVIFSSKSVDDWED